MAYSPKTPKRAKTPKRRSNRIAMRRLSRRYGSRKTLARAVNRRHALGSMFTKRTNYRGQRTQYGRNRGALMYRKSPLAYSRSSRRSCRSCQSPRTPESPTAAYRARHRKSHANWMGKSYKKKK